MLYLKTPQLFIIQENIQSKEDKSEAFDILTNGFLQKMNQNDSYFYYVEEPELRYLSNDCHAFGRTFDYYGDTVNVIE